MRFTEWMNRGFIGEFVANDTYSSYQRCKELRLADGTELSIQAGRTHYCQPRDNSPVVDYDFYVEFEIGFPTKKIDEIMRYIDGCDSDPTDTVYGYVPKGVIEDLIKKRGGVVGLVDNPIFVVDE